MWQWSSPPRWIVHLQPRAVPDRCSPPSLHCCRLPRGPCAARTANRRDRRRLARRRCHRSSVATVGTGDDFVREVEGLIQPKTSALFVLDSEGDMGVILHAIQGLGGTVLRTNVDLKRAQLIQSTLAAAAVDTSKPENEL